MKYLEIYNKMIEVYQKVPGIRRNLCQFFNIKEDSNTLIRDLISDNYKFNNNVDSLIKFINDFYSIGGITDDCYLELQAFIEGSKKRINRIIFAAKDKLDVTIDVTYNEIDIKKDDEKYLIYQKEPFDTITWTNLWGYFDDIEYLFERVTRFCLDRERRFYDAYTEYLKNTYNNEEKFNEGNYPELLSQYVLKNRTKTITELGGSREVIHRIDFAFILNNKVILIELDGNEHYSIRKETGYGIYYNADFNKISDERKIDRELLLEGYEIYRFLNKDIDDRNAEELIEYLTPFFNKLFLKHNIVI